MKKTVIALFAIAALMASCNNGKTNTAATAGDSIAADSTVAQDSMVYEGLTPAADVFGIRYRLALAADSTKGYSLKEDYMDSETEVKQSFESNGTYEQTEKDGKTYIKVGADKDNALNFLQLNDSTLRMVNSELEEPVATEGMNYDLKLVK